MFNQIIYTLRRKILHDKNYPLIFLTIISFFIFFYHPENFKFFICTTFVVFSLFLFLTKNILSALYCTLFISQHFLIPGKYYSFVLFDIGKIRAEPFFSTGIIDGYGLLASDILSIVLTVYIIRSGIREVLGSKGFVLSIWRHWFIRISIICFLSYFFISLYSSLHYSFNPVFSVVNLLQYSKFFLFFFATILLVSTSKGYSHFFILITGTSFAQCLIALGQFIQDINSLAQGDRYVPFYSPVEENLRLTFLQGIYLHSHEFALFLFLFLILLLWVYSQTKRKIYLIAGIGNSILILLSQSRTIWFIAFVACFIFFRRTEKKLIQFIRKDWKRTVSIVITSIVVLIIVFPRLSLLQYTLDNGSGAIRLKMIQEGLDTLSESPWVGFGNNTVVKAVSDFFPMGYIQDFPYAVHMGYIQMAIESGILGTIFFFLPFFLTIRTSIARVMKNSKNSFSFASTLCLLAIIIYYVIQPHGGRHELPLIGSIMGIIVAGILYEF